ncbi:MAG: MerR family transcriptional regulator [Gammaproteobacteria bacterium]|nr:MerR family transcriptional regulator [Gammaproteobacteria bacterium]
MKIGELAKRTGLTASRIRFYEASGLIHAVERKANGYREYPQEAVWTLEIITQAQKAGFALDEIRHLLPTTPNNWEHDELLIGLKRKVAEIEALQKRLEYNRAQLLVVIAGVESGAMPCADKQEWLLDRLREQGLYGSDNREIEV